MGNAGQEVEIVVVQPAVPVVCGDGDGPDELVSFQGDDATSVDSFHLYDGLDWQ